MTRTSILTVTTALLAAVAGGCTPATGGSGAPPGPVTASAMLTTSFSSSGAITCTAGPIQWSAVPVALSPGEGNTSAVTDTEPRHDIQPSGGRCTLSHRFTDLRPGTWRFTVAAGVANGTCDANLAPGLTFIGFDGGVCSTRP
jgi:hypothetical protein